MNKKEIKKIIEGKIKLETEEEIEEFLKDKSRYFLIGMIKASLIKNKDDN